MRQVRMFIIIAGPCIMTGLSVHLATSTTHLLVLLSLAAVIAALLAFLEACAIEWSRQDSVSIATLTLAAELNERNTEIAALRRQLERMKRIT